MHSVKYFVCPEFISFKTTENSLILVLLSDTKDDFIFFEQYYNYLILFVNNLEHLVKKKSKLRSFFERDKKLNEIYTYLLYL